MAFIGVQVPQEIIKVLAKIDVPGDCEPSHELHSTLIFLGKKLSLDEISKVMQAVYYVCAEFKPFIIKTKLVSCFPKHEGKSAIICKVISPELEKLNDKLKEKLDEEGIEFSKTFKDFKPHITLSYNDKEIDEFDINPVEFMVNEIVIWAGDYGGEKLTINISLDHGKKSYAEFLKLKSEVFLKIAG